MTYRHLLFIGLVLLSIFTWWLSGYNFDKRNIWVGYGFIVNVFFIGFAVTFPTKILNEKIFK